MSRRILIGWLLCVLSGAPLAQAGVSAKDALGSIPGDAMAFICAPDLKTLDARFGQAIKTLGLGEMIPPPMHSLVNMLRENVPPLAGIGTEGTLAIVMLPADHPMMLMTRALIVLPVDDPKKFVTDAQGQEGEGGVWTISLMGQPAFARLADKQVVIAQAPDGLKSIAEGAPRMSERLKASDLTILEGLDLIIWADAEKLIKLFKPQIDAGLQAIQAIQGAQGTIGAAEGAATKKQFDMLIEGAASLGFGLSLGDPGLDLRFAFTAKPGSELAKQSKVTPTRDSLLRGLPGKDYMAAFGQAVDSGQIRSSMDAVDPYFALLEGQSGVDSATVGELKSLVKEWMPKLSGLRGQVEMLPEGTDGLIGFSLVVMCPDSAQWVDLALKAVEKLRTIGLQATTEMDASVKKAIEAFSHTRDAEEIAGVKVAHLKFDVAAVEEMDEDDRESMKKIVGQDGLLVRLATAGKEAVAVTFGGGAGYMNRLIESVKKNEPMLDAEPGIKKVAAHLPAERSSVVFVSVDRILSGVNRILKTIEEDLLPVTIPVIDAPLAVTQTGGENWIRIDFFVPTDLMVAAKNMIVQMMTASEEPAPDGKLDEESDQE